MTKRKPPRPLIAVSMGDALVVGRQRITFDGVKVGMQEFAPRPR